MASINPYSLERYIIWRNTVLSLLIVLLIATICWLIGVPLVWNIIFCLMIATLLCRSALIFKRKTIQAFNRATLHLDAIINEDYHQFAKPSFQQGKVAEFHRQLRALSEHLQRQTSQYDPHAFLVYQLIFQLDAPVLVFNEKQLLTYSNDAFSDLFGQHWQVYRHYSPERLGLTCSDGVWSFKDKNKQGKWQIRHSDFINDGQAFQLFICINIESALRKSQLAAWQQIIRVLSHEIRNSLTPVSSMAESLADRSESAREKHALTVITERCLHLQQFVERYSSLSTHYQLAPSWISVEELIASLQLLFKGLSLELNIGVSQFWGDRYYLEQAIINLLKNAAEANAQCVKINVANHDAFTVIELHDNGHGFARFDNLYVPLYSTKPNGQGIGLNFCRNIIEQHNGVLEVTNHEQGGAMVMIILPIKTDDDENTH